MNTLQDKTIVVTGASRGIGRAIALHLAANGANVCVNYLVSKEQAEEVVAEIEKTGGKAIAVCADVTNSDKVAYMVKRTRKAFGSIFGVVNNAGARIDHTKFVDTGWEGFEIRLSSQIRAIYNTVMAALSDMIKAKSGSIVNIASAFKQISKIVS